MNPAVVLVITPFSVRYEVYEVDDSGNNVMVGMGNDVTGALQSASNFLGRSLYLKLSAGDP